MITQNTNTLKIEFANPSSGKTFAFLNASIEHLVLDVIDGHKKDNPVVSLVWPAPTESIIKQPVREISFQGIKRTFNVNFKNIKNKLPIVIGMRLITRGGKNQGSGFYKIAEFDAPELKHLHKNPIINSTVPNENGLLNGTDTTISGTATPGDTVTCDLNGESQIVGKNGIYTFDFNGKAIGTFSKLKSNREITVTETDDSTGATGSATAMVDKVYFPLKFNQNLIFLTEKIDDFSTDEQVLKWLKEVLDPSDPDSDKNEQITLHSKKLTDGELAEKVKKISPENPLQVSIYGEKEGGEQSLSQDVTIRRSPGTVSVEGGKLNFGKLRIPGTRQYFSIQSPFSITVRDTRNHGSKWTLSAMMTSEMKLNNKEPSKSVGLFYHDDDHYQKLSPTPIPIASDNKSMNVSEGWGPSKGIVLRADSGTQVGTYTGSIEWNLSFTP